MTGPVAVPFWDSGVRFVELSDIWAWLIEYNSEEIEQPSEFINFLAILSHFVFCQFKQAKDW
jgi:hypothetical protein